MALPVTATFMTTLPDGRSQRVSHYRFVKAGDEIPLHVHPFFHSTCVLIGRCEIYDDAGKSAIVEAGSFVEFPKGRQHAIRALVDGTHIVNLPEPGR
jgi:quercetin dioxygenase-like cupin family protein